MRLINTRTLELREFSNPDEINDNELILEEPEPDQSKPNEQRLNGYAILSHTWGDEEVTFQDWLYVTKQNPARWGWIYNKEEARRIKARQGYKKIKGACKQARDEGFSWIWADTNCIDKTNLTELSEAINSMYHWYQKAQVCYVYLADVPPCSREDCIREGSRFRGSRWFTRGWTLQELIAPKHLKFFSNSWTLISNKPEIKKTIEEITNIPSSVLTNPYDLTCRGGHLSIAEIMSWASTRTTTRKEDMAYSLMGLFDVNMPLLYGEGTKAFIRLQLEIIQKSSDVTFLVWKRELSLSRLKAEAENSSWLAWTMETIAQEPKAFCFGPDVHEIVGAVGLHWATEYPRYLRISNLGLSLSIPLVETLHPNLQFAVLPYSYSGRELWVPLGAFGGDYYRLGGSNFATMSVSTIGYTAKETELTLPIYRSSNPCGIPIKYDRQIYRDHWKGSHVNILLAFPAGLCGYKVLETFPPIRYSRGQEKSVLFQLCIEGYSGTIAYGGIEFEKISQPGQSETEEKAAVTKAKRVAVFFAAEFGNPNNPTPNEWTCRDISRPQFKMGNLDLDLESRTRSQFAYLIDPTFDDMVISGWRHRFLLKGEGAQADHGVILLDNSLHKRNSVSSEESARGDVFIVAQIIFPDQGYHGTW